jgi:ubiquinone/menaquinone biosynthesis C-methylase UbiE
MVDDKVNCMLKAKEYEVDYWDGHRRYGYGGYTYIPGRWTPVAEALIEHFGLTGSSSVLDVGCGKGFLLYEMKQILPDLTIAGFDISRHGLSQSKQEIRNQLFHHKAQEPYPYREDAFDLVISLGCLHNLRVFELEHALREIDRVGRQGYVMVESYRNEQEQFNLQCWALTCEAFFDVDEWIWLYDRFGYTGNYEFIFFE